MSDVEQTTKRLGSQNGSGAASTPPRLVIPDHDLICRIGEGAYGEVWLARNIFGRYRAVKAVFRASFKTDEPYEREFRGIQRFEPISRSNDGFVDVLQVGRNDTEGCFYYVMELADPVPREEPSPAGRSKPGRSLPPSPSGCPSVVGFSPLTYAPRTLREEIRLRGSLSPQDCVQLGLSLSLALAHLHRNGLLHRDIKPSNIIFVDGIPKLADIGLVTDFTDARSYVGTEGFIPPEGPNTSQADIYGLGKVLYEISTGKDRKDFPEPGSLLGTGAESDRLEELNAVILKACAPAPNDRYQTAEELHADLALLNSGRSVRSRRALERRLKWAKKAIGAALAVAALASAAYVSQRQQTREAQRNLYFANMDRAQRDWENANMARLARILNETEPYPDKGFEWSYWRRQLHLDRTTLSGHTGSVSIAFSPDGRSLVSGGGDTTVRIWDLAGGWTVRVIQGHHWPVVSVAYSPDGNRIITGSHDGSVKIWDAGDGHLIQEITDGAAMLFAAVASPDGQRIVTATRPDSTRTDLSVNVWDARSGQKLQVLADRTGGHGMIAIAFSADGRLMAAITDRFAVTCWDAPTSRQRFVCRSTSEFYSIALSPNGQRLLTGSGSDAVLWDTADGKQLMSLQGGNERGVAAVAYSPDGHKLATGGYDQRLIVWDAATGRELFRLSGHRAGIGSVAFSPDGQRIATGSVDGTVKIWDASGLPNPRTFPNQIKEISMLAISPDGNRLVTTTWDKAVQIWEAATGRELLALQPKAEVPCVAFSPDGRRLATGNGWHGPYATDHVKIWDCSNGQELLSVEGKGFVAFSPEGRRLATSSGHHSATIWDSVTGAELVRFDGHADWVQCGTFSPDGKRIATACGDQTGGRRGQRTVKIWEAATARELLTIARSEPMNDISSCLAFSPDGKRLAFANNDRMPRVWDSTTGRELLVLDGHMQMVTRIAFSPDGKRLLTLSQDRTAKLWDASTGRELLTLAGHAKAVRAGAFFPDGRRIATAGLDGRIKIWATD